MASECSCEFIHLSTGGGACPRRSQTHLSGIISDVIDRGQTFLPFYPQNQLVHPNSFFSGRSLSYLVKGQQGQLM